MKISEIIPYENNARNNADAIEPVAESIRDFGLRGQIVLESRENPVIVCGHTRVEACKSLGWDEIPDEKIDFADDLTPEQLKAYRLADNRTGEVATWNRAKLKKEIHALEAGGVDMGRFRFDFKSKQRPYGAERLRTDITYNLRIVSAKDCDEEGMPTIEPTDHVPASLVGFNHAMGDADKGSCVHFFLDDYQFERLWNRPERYVEILRRYDSVLTPDFSLYMDMPLPMQRWNEYRRRALGHYWQSCGLTVIPTLSWTDARSYGFCFHGLPKHSTVATSSVGVMEDQTALGHWAAGMEAALAELEPRRVLLYGGDPGFVWPDGVEVVNYAAGGRFE